MQLLGHTLDLVGKVLVSYTVIAVHYRFRKEHKIDEAVFSANEKGTSTRNNWYFINDYWIYFGNPIDS